MKRLILIAVAVATVSIMGVSLGMVQSRQFQARELLERDLSLSQLRLSKTKNASGPLSERQEELEARLVQARSQLDLAKADLLQKIETIEVDKTLFDIAKSAGVEIVEIRATAPTDIELRGVRYSVLSMTVRINGDISNITQFVTKWIDRVRTGMVESVDITPPRTDGRGQTVWSWTQPSQEGVSEGNQPENNLIPPVVAKRNPASANLNLVIYTYRGG